jgi:sulfatase modifying factor 1
MVAPSALSSGRWSPTAFVLVAIAACGGRENGIAGSGSSSAVSSGASTAAASGASSASTGSSSGSVAGATSGSGTGLGSTGLASGASAGSGTSGSSGSGSPDAGVDAGMAVPPSCAPGGPGMIDCGPGGTGTESCCTSLEVAGGTYYRTYTNDGTGPTGEADPATVSSFRLDKYLVTVGRFRQFVSAVLPPDGGAGWLPSPGSGKHTHLNGGNGLNATGGGYEPGWVATDDGNVAPTNANLACDAMFATWTNSAGTQENLPINCVNWWESYAFCIWDGGFLPSEAEFEYAAAGGSQQREYPWGSTAPGTACPGTGCQYAIYGCEYPSGTEVCVGVANIAPVGTATLGAGLWGQLDLAGDVSEWNLDWYAPYEPCTDCADFVATPSRVLRGGYFGFPNAAVLLSPRRDTDTPASRDNSIGFRCSRSAP